MNNLTLFVLTSVLVQSCCFTISVQAGPIEPGPIEFVRQTVKNSTDPPVTANDLTLDFTVEIRDPIIGVDANGNGIIEDSEKHKGAFDGPGDQRVVFAPATFGNVGSGAKAYIDYGRHQRAGSKIDAVRSTWTFDGAPHGGVNTIGEPMLVAYNPVDGDTRVTFFNPELFALLYTDVTAYADNLNSNFTILDFADPTGAPRLIPTMFVLNPGESITFSIGPNDPLLYDLVFANVASLTAPADQYALAAAAGVPEPRTTVLFLSGAAFLFLRRAASRLLGSVNGLSGLEKCSPGPNMPGAERR